MNRPSSGCEFHHFVASSTMRISLVGQSVELEDELVDLLVNCVDLALDKLLVMRSLRGPQ